MSVWEYFKNEGLSSGEGATGPICNIFLCIDPWGSGVGPVARPGGDRGCRSPVQWATGCLITRAQYLLLLCLITRVQYLLVCLLQGVRGRRAVTDGKGYGGLGVGKNFWQQNFVILKY